MNPGSRQERIEEAARVSGLRDFRTPTLEAVERRRVQLWGVALLVLILVAGGMALTSWAPSTGAGRHLPLAALVGVLVMASGFCAYVVEKGRALRRLTRMLVDERVLTAALSNRLKELSALAAVGKAVNSVLDLEDVLSIILSSAIELLEGEGGSIMLLEDQDTLHALCVVGNDLARGARLPVGSSVAGTVAATREALLISGAADPDRFPNLVAREKPVRSSVSVPLLHRGELMGVLNLSAASDRTFTEYDLRAMTLFAEHAALSIANARLYEAEVERVAELIEVNRMKSEFVANVSHELRTPLTSILGSVITMRNLEMDRQQNDEFLDAIERQGRRLLRMIEELLVAARLEEGLPAVELAPVDLGRLARTVAADMSRSGNSIEVLGPDTCVVNGEPDVLHRVLVNLIDNATKHGAPPIRVAVARTNGQVTLSVIDAGPGVPDQERDRIDRKSVV